MGTASDTAPGRPRRPRDSAATRQALLAAASELFATVGYDATTVRAIADRAGVNQALLFRHFGNKEALFAEAVTGQAMEVLNAGPPESLLPRILDSMLSEDASGGELFYAVLRSAGNSEAAAAVRDELSTSYGRAFASLADTDDPADAAVRANLLMAWLLGIGLLRTVLKTEPLAHADPQAITAHVMRVAPALLETSAPSR
ncbi:TetR/AcrR family transcriptional regulator [Pseudonocardia asaccharolytica]|uniref:TetR family transcriptional regulator n=1 Tax=Pseudonocardia asaccharolytica DSM 44247 = NBRC 16224 TaxID=1123024 RepID=A0A511CX30_9PSEU|nr:TetR/AcrR family transcriptional regulator [Pseudonocardia asaccharolytica]GEL17120.1 TetR family transcriptional regulator [Pseudonocardia asaccharolytica DSM 44247 = NBRC 16224]